MKTGYALLSAVLLVLLAQMALAQGDPGGGMTWDHRQLMFVSQPPLSGRVGDPYMYTAKAVSKDSTAVIHYFTQPMSNQPVFAIDSVTGIVTWTPKAPGWYTISILARSDKGEYGLQRFTVTVTAGSGVVWGKVTAEQTASGIPGIIVEILQARNVSPSIFGCISFVTRTDANGNYKFPNIPPGRYLLHAVSPTPQYLSQWYDGKSSPDSADQILVADSSETRADFVLHEGPTPAVLASIMGLVQDTAGTPIKGAEVFFVRSGFALNTNSSVEDFRRLFDVEERAFDFHIDGHSLHVLRALTDSTGGYSLKAPAGEYVAYARVKGYAVSFYLDKQDLLTADHIKLVGDTTGIDFTLLAFPKVALGTIQGAVVDSAKGVGVRSRVIAIRDTWSTLNFFGKFRAYTVDSDSLGVYSIENLLPGSYIVLALPMGSYAPAFYAADTSSATWRKATRIAINGNTVTGITIYVHEIPVLAHGFTGIQGSILPGGEPASAAAGTIVFAMYNSTVAGFGIADASGHYQIAGLAPGTYTVTADLPGFDAVASKTATATYSSTGAPQYGTANLNLSAVVMSVESEGAAVPETFVLSQNYPNPFNPTTLISYQLPSAVKVDLRVYDVLGREVAVLASGIQAAGEHTAKFDARSLASGMYFYRLSAGTATATMKMMLLK
jgi:hypothetical protein